MRVEFTADAAKDVASLDKKTARRIVDKIDWFASQSDPLKFAKRLQDPRKLYRFRIGEYRAIFTIRGQAIILLVLAVKNQKEAYR
jgi:mRNA interferase RelE/StbE